MESELDPSQHLGIDRLRWVRIRKRLQLGLHLLILVYYLELVGLVAFVAYSQPKTLEAYGSSETLVQESRALLRPSSPRCYPGVVLLPGGDHSSRAMPVVQPRIVRRDE
jgi:hypothetical protein